MIDIETDAERLAGALVAIARILRGPEPERLHRTGTGAGQDAGRRAPSCSVPRRSRARPRPSATTTSWTTCAGAFQFPDRVAGVTRRGRAPAFCRRIFRLGNVNCVIYLPEDTDTSAHGIPTEAGALEGPAWSRS